MYRLRFVAPFKALKTSNASVAPLRPKVKFLATPQIQVHDGVELDLVHLVDG